MSNKSRFTLYRNILKCKLTAIQSYLRLTGLLTEKRCVQKHVPNYFFIVSVFRKTIRGTCKEWVPFAEPDCITCLEYFDDEMACNSDVTCIFTEGVCLFDTSKTDG